MKHIGGTMISDSSVKPGFVERAKEVWRKYQEANDVSHLRGMTAAIDPESGRVWIGDDPIRVFDQITADGFGPPVYLVRVGYDYLVRKRRR